MIDELIIFIILMMLGYSFGRIAETSHYHSIKKRERKLRKLITVPVKTPPSGIAIEEAFLASGSVVISIDYFKGFLAGLRSIVGGRVKSFETLLDRGRREAILRMKEEAKEKGANMIFNVKLETASISKGQKNSVGSIEVLAYGTALVTGEEERADEIGELIIAYVPQTHMKKVVKKIAKMTKSDEERITRRLSSLPAVISSNVTREKADRVQDALDKYGVNVDFVPAGDEESD